MWGGTLAGGTVIPGNGNIFTLIHCRSRSAFVSEIGDVLMQHVTEAALAWQVRRPLATRFGLLCFPFGAGQQASAASETGLGQKA